MLSLRVQAGIALSGAPRINLTPATPLHFDEDLSVADFHRIDLDRLDRLIFRISDAAE